MKFIRGYDRHLDRGCVLTVGGFESLHRGHQALIACVRERAGQAGLPSAVVVFEPLPGEFFTPAGDPGGRIYRFSRRARIIRSLKPDFLVCLRFCKQLAGMSAREFIERVLVGALRGRHVVIGKNFRFGKDRLGDCETLKVHGARHGFTVEEVEMSTVDNRPVSSTWVRETLREGDFEVARRLLGRAFDVHGRVVAGDGRGRQLGFPTANIACGRRKPPLHGVFVGEVTLARGATYAAAVNAGFRPTIGGREYRIEAHLLNFSDSIYGRKIAVRPLVKIRDERRFESVVALKAAIAQDVQAVRAFSEAGGKRTAMTMRRAR